MLASVFPGTINTPELLSVGMTQSYLMELDKRGERKKISQGYETWNSLFTKQKALHVTLKE